MNLSTRYEFEIGIRNTIYNHTCTSTLNIHSKPQLPNRFNLQFVPVDDVFLLKDIIDVPNFDSSVYGRGYYLKASSYYCMYYILKKIVKERNIPTVLNLNLTCKPRLNKNHTC